MFRFSVFSWGISNFRSRQLRSLCTTPVSPAVKIFRYWHAIIHLQNKKRRKNPRTQLSLWLKNYRTVCFITCVYAFLRGYNFGFYNGDRHFSYSRSKYVSLFFKIIIRLYKYDKEYTFIVYYYYFTALAINMTLRRAKISTFFSIQNNCTASCT